MSVSLHAQVHRRHARIHVVRGPKAPPDEFYLHDFRLESGEVMPHVTVAFHTWGTLNDRRDNAIVVCHTLTGDTRATEWWSDLVGPGKPIDTDRFFVVCANILGSPYGSSSPVTGQPGRLNTYGGAFPRVSIRDSVSVQRRLVRYLGVKQVACVVGASMGGMLALEFAFHRDLVRSIVVIAAGARHSPWSIAWTEAQRQAIFADPDWNGGAYAPDRPPLAGLAAARMMAMVSYRTSSEFDQRFGREANGSGFDIESYLHHQGRKFVDRFDANCYVSLTRQLNTHDVGRSRGGHEEALGALPQPALVVGIRSDVLYPLHEQIELSSLLPGGRLEVMSSHQGHDSFLADQKSLATLATPFFNRHVHPYA